MRRSGGLFVAALAAATFVSSRAAAEPVGRLTAHLTGTPAAALAPLRTGVAETFAGDGRVTFLPIASLLPQAAADPAALLHQADDELDEGDKAFSGMDIDPAKQHLAAAVAAYRAWLPELVKRDGSAQRLTSAFILLSKVYFFDGDTANARMALRHCLTLDTRLSFSARVFPPQMKRLVQEVRAEYDLGGTGRLTVESVPPGAGIYVDGGPRPGATPQELTLPNGPHDVRLDLAGHKSAVESVDVPGGGATRLAAVLPEAPTRADARLAPLMQKLDAGAPPPELAEAARELGVDLLALASASSLGSGRVQLRGWLYDARRNLVLKRAAREVAGSDEELRLGGRYFARELTSGVRLDGRPEPPPHRATLAERWQGFRESRWFWPVIGTVGGLLASGAAVGIGVGVSRQRGATDDAVNSVVLTGGR